MWYEIIPSAAIIYACLALPEFISPMLIRLTTGQNNIRDLRSQHYREMFHRDCRITDGSVWKRIRLEAVPDQPEIK